MPFFRGTRFTHFNVPEIKYDLFADWRYAGDDTFSDADVLKYMSQGVQSGSLTVVDTGGGTVKVVGNELELLSSNAWDNTGLRETSGVTKALGKALFLISTHNSNAADVFGWNTAASINRVTGFNAQTRSDDIIYITASGVGSASMPEVGTVVHATDYKFLMLQGGYDTNGIPFKVGDTVGNFLYGVRTFIKGGTYTNWTLLWLNPTNNTTPLYAFVQLHTNQATYFDNLLIPTNVLNVDVMFQPQFLATFAGDNDDNLSGYVPEVIGGEAGFGAELHIDANAASDPKGNEANDIGGWYCSFLAGTGANVFESQGTVKNIGSYALHANADPTPTGGARFLRDISTDFNLTIGKTYRLTFDWRHIGGAGGLWSARFSSSTTLGADVSEVDTVDNSDVTFRSLSYDFTYTANYRYFGFRELSDNNNGGIYADNLSCKEITTAFESGSTTWTIQDGKASNDPGLGVDLLDSWDFQVGWTATSDSAIDDADSFTTTIVARGIYKSALLTVGETYRLVIAGSTTAARLDLRNIEGVSVSIILDILSGGGNTYFFTAEKTGFYFSNGVSGGTTDITTLELYNATINETFASDDLGITQGIFDVDVTILTANDGFAGLVLALDSVASPANYIEVFYNRATGKVECAKYVAGSRTSLINETATYAAGAQLRAIVDYISDTDDLKVKVYYNGALIGTEQTIEDNGIAGNTRHGIMSVDSSNSLDNFAVHSRTDSNWDAEIAKSTGGVY